MAATWFNRGKYALGSGGLNLASDTLKLLLLDGDYAFNPDNNFVSDLSSDEITGTGYTGGFAGSGRKTLGSQTFTEDDAGNLATFDAADPTAYTALDAGTIKWAIIWKPNSTDANSIVVCALEFSPVIVTVGYDVTIKWPTAGIATLA